MKPICRNIQNNQFYEFLGGTKFRNIITDKEGEVPEDKAREILKFNIEATEIINQYPAVRVCSALKI